jgi:hypothetical protein
MNENDKTEFMKNLDEMSKVYAEISEANEKEADEFWESLSKEDQEKAFYAVIKRMYKAELEDNGSYRWALYDVFGFGPHMYAQGMDCGYMALHNAIFDGEELMAMGGVNRLEVIDDSGRAYTKYFKPGDVDYVLQDENRTLKIFIEEKKHNEYQTQFDF